MFIFFISYLSYALTETLHYAGVISLIVVGVVLSSYGWYNLSDQGKQSTSLTFQLVGSLSQGLLFIFLGLSVFFNYTKSYSQNFSWVTKKSHRDLESFSPRKTKKNL